MASFQAICGDGSDKVIRARMNAIRPVIVEKVCAATQKRDLHLDSDTWARRNVAEHSSFGGGPEALAGNAKSTQRGG